MSVCTVAAFSLGPCSKAFFSHLLQTTEWYHHTCHPTDQCIRVHCLQKKNPSVIQAPLHTLFTRTIERKTLQLEVQCECMIDRRSRLMIGPRTWVASSPPWKTTSRPGQCVFSSSRKHCKMPKWVYDTMNKNFVYFRLIFFIRISGWLKGQKANTKLSWGMRILPQLSP